MKLEELIQKRSENKCELCKAEVKLSMYEVPPANASNEENNILICTNCQNQIDKKSELDSTHWACLKESMWSEVAGIQLVAWRMLNRLKNESWAMESLDMMYLDDEKLAWAKTTGDHENTDVVQLHRDSNNHILQTGDTIVLIKSLDVKGSTLTARLGTVVRNIRLVDDNFEQIEGRVEGQQIVILTKYVRKQN